MKNWLRPPPPGGGGVWWDILAVNLNHRLIDGSTVYIINTEVPALGDSLSWDTNQCVCDITTNDFTGNLISHPHAFADDTA